MRPSALSSVHPCGMDFREGVAVEEGVVMTTTMMSGALLWCRAAAL